MVSLHACLFCFNWFLGSPYPCMPYALSPRWPLWSELLLWVLNSGPRACTLSSLLSEPFPKPLCSFRLFCWNRISCSPDRPQTPSLAEAGGELLTLLPLYLSQAEVTSVWTPHVNSFPNKLVGWNFSTGHSYGLDLGCLLVTSAVKPQSEGAPAAQPPNLISRWQRWQNFYLSWHNWTTRRHRDSIVTWCSHTIQAVEMALPLRVFQCYSTIPHRHLLIRSHSHPPKEPGCAPQPLHPFPIGLNLAYLGLGLQLSPGPLDGTVSLQISKSTKLQAWSSCFDPSLLSPVPHILHNLRESQQSPLHPTVLSKTLSSFFFQSPAVGLERGLRTCCFPRGPGLSP